MQSSTLTSLTQESPSTCVGMRTFSWRCEGSCLPTSGLISFRMSTDICKSFFTSEWEKRLSSSRYFSFIWWRTWRRDKGSQRSCMPNVVKSLENCFTSEGRERIYGNRSIGGLWVSMVLEEEKPSPFHIHFECSISCMATSTSASLDWSRKEYISFTISIYWALSFSV